MKIIGKSKQGHRILLVTELEWEIITEAMFEYEQVCGWSEAITALKDIKMVNKRLNKAVNKFEALQSTNTLKKLTHKAKNK